MALTSIDLRQFTGSESYTRHGLNRKLIYTDGISYVAQEGNAYWLIDAIAIANLFEENVKDEEFQTWTMAKTTGNSATLKADNGNGKTLYTQEIEFTDFPLDEIKMYVVSAEDFGAGAKMLMLPSEY